MRPLRVFLYALAMVFQLVIMSMLIAEFFLAFYFCFWTKEYPKSLLMITALLVFLLAHMRRERLEKIGK